jgi:PKD repeat protein
VSWDIFAHVLIQPNRAPVADAGNDAEIFLGESAALNGAGSSDPDNPAPQLTYLWSIEAAPEGSNAVIVQANDEITSFMPDMLGEYLISLIVNDGEVDSVPDEILISVVQNLAPQAVIHASVISGVAPLTVAFDGVNSSDPESSPLLYQWNFNDPDSLQNLSGQVSDTHIFNQPGQYTVVLTVTDNFGQSAQAMVMIDVEAPETPNAPPAVQPLASPANGSVPLKVNFTANAVDENGDALTYFWDFADGSTATESNPAHLFTQAGVYDVTLTVSDGEYTAHGSVRVTAGASFSFASQFVKLEINNKKPFKDNIQIKARIDISSTSIMPEDTVRLSVNQIVLAEQPFSAFSAGDDGEEWIYQEKHIQIKLDLAAGFIKLSKHKTDLSPLNTEQPLNIEMAFGNRMAGEQIQLQKVNDKNCDKKTHDEKGGGQHDQCEKEISKYIYKATGYYSPHPKPRTSGHDGKHDEHHSHKSHD